MVEDAGGAGTASDVVEERTGCTVDDAGGATVVYSVSVTTGGMGSPAPAVEAGTPDSWPSTGVVGTPAGASVGTGGTVVYSVVVTRSVLFPLELAVAAVEEDS